MSDTSILLVDDDVELTALLKELLHTEGFEVTSHFEGTDAAAMAVGGSYALVILDVMLPSVDGFEVLREIRRTSSMPVILLTARGEDADRVVGLEIGADDYLPKPFNPRELVLRMRAVLRRSENAGQPGLEKALRVGEVVLDPPRRLVLSSGRRVELTPVEFDILHHLLAAAGRTVTRDALAEQVLGRALSPDDRSIDVHISKVRRKLGPHLSGDDRIKSIRGTGYIYTLPRQDES
jgi:two-component system response regulator CpxR